MSGSSLSDEDIQQLILDVRAIKSKLDTNQQYTELLQRVEAIEDRLDQGNPMDLARDFTVQEIRNICVKAIAQGISFFLANLLLGLLWENFLPRAQPMLDSNSNSNSNSNSGSNSNSNSNSNINANNNANKIKNSVSGLKLD